jgi:hypothetical protein
MYIDNLTLAAIATVFVIRMPARDWIIPCGSVVT